MNALMDPETTPINRIAALLATTSAVVRDEGPATWSLQPVQRDSPVTARWVEDWLQLAAGPLTPAAAWANGIRPETLLRWNSRLAGQARFSVDGWFQLALRAEVLWQDDIDPGPALSQALAGIEHGLDLLDGTQDTSEVSDVAAEQSAALRPLAEATGWTFHARQDGRIDFDLDETDASLQAALQQRIGGSVGIGLTLTPLVGLSETSRRALAVLLLRAGAVLRLARPALSGEGATTCAVLEVVFATTPEPHELALALESLAVGAALVAAEAKMLCHEQMAKEFLITGNWTPQENNHNHQPKDEAW